MSYERNIEANIMRNILSEFIQDGCHDFTGDPAIISITVERMTATIMMMMMMIYFYSPSSIVNSVSASLNEVLAMNVMEKDIRMRLAELQKKYREKHRELARLQPKGKHG